MMSSNYTAIDNQNVSGSVPAVADPSPQVSVKFTESNLQTFPPSTSQGKISRSSGPPRDADDAVVVVIGTWAFDDKMCLSVVPFEIFRWVIAGVAGFMSATFVALNLKTHITSSGERWFLIVVGIFLLQLALALVLKLYLFTVTV
nr:protein YIPF1 homolog [Ipomoea batatas]